MKHKDYSEILQLLDACMLKHRQDFYRRFNKIRNNRNSKTEQAGHLQKLVNEISVSVEQSKSRHINRPLVSYPDILPVSQKRENILNTVRDHQVTILCGETGSGKTTQIPKICLELGRGTRGLIGHTQPRRLAARAVASRLTEELGTQASHAVGYKVRFSDTLNENSYIKLMTDGILLAECHHDPYLNQYDTLIIDEAHERSLNIDFLLGYLKRLISKRRDLKIIITSATIDPERFSKHFDNAPIITVSGRTYPVDVHYHPLHREDNDDDQQRDLQQGVVDAVEEITHIDRGDILVFLSGERDIREIAEALGKQQLQNTEVLPLLARLSASEQNRIFHGSSKRRIILSTNVAETSLTVPGIKYVIDSGLARISRYSWRSKIQRLPIEKISQASANQRKGRCGRVANGICIRLYDEDDFKNRSEFTEPEIKRTNLAAVILQMENLGLGHIDDFPFVEPPDERLINDGYKLLHELGALDPKRKITRIGKNLSRLPIDPRLGRMLLEADKEAAINEVLIIVSALATQDPRERPMAKQQAADEKHRTWFDKDSDFIFYTNLWREFHKQKKLLSSNKLRKWCKQHYLSWMRIREWTDTHRQIKKMLQEMKITFNKHSADYAAIHRALLTGLLGNIGIRDTDKEFIGVRNRRFNIFPGSCLFKKPPQWIMSSEIVETTKVYARLSAKIEPGWIEDKARHLIKHSYDNPHWEKAPAQVVATQRSTLYGLLVQPGRKVNYGPVMPELSREIFILSALVQHDFNCNEAFFKHNHALNTELETLEAKSRRQDILVDDETLYHFYDEQLPRDIYNGALFKKWIKNCSDEQIKQLFISKDYLMQHDAAHVTSDQFPDQLEINGVHYPLNYHFDINHKHDGITLVTPLAGLEAVNAQRCEWLVPGMLHSKMVALIRSLPKSLRRNFVPAPNFADACFEALEAGNTSLSSAMSLHLKKITGTEIPYDAWRPELIDKHLFINIRVIDEHGHTLEESRDLATLKEKFSGNQTKTVIAITSDQLDDSKANSINQDNVGPDILDQIPDHIEVKTHGVTIKAYPALIKKGNTVILRTVDSRHKADKEHKKGLRQLFINALPQQIRHLKKNLPDINTLCMKFSSLGSCEELKAALLNTVVDQCFLQNNIASSKDFRIALDTGKSELIDTASSWCQILSTILDEYKKIQKQIKSPTLDMLDTITDIQHQLQHLFPEDFIINVDKKWLQHYPRYLKAIDRRLQKVQSNVSRDRQLRLQLADLWCAYQKRHDTLQKQHIISKQLEHYRWMLEEYRVSLFAQDLKTCFPVSEKRLKAYWNQINDV